MKSFLASLVAFGLPGLFISAIIDGIGVPIPGGVDVLLIYLGSRRPDEILLLAALAVLGSTVGNSVLFGFARKGGDMFLEKRSGSKTSKRFRRWFDRYGLLTVFISALVPLPIMPMKIFVFCSGALGISPSKFLLAFVAARVPRYFGLVWLGRSMGDNAMAYLRAHLLHLSLFAAGLTAVLWIMIRYVDRQNARKQPVGAR